MHFLSSFYTQWPKMTKWTNFFNKINSFIKNQKLDFRYVFRIFIHYFAETTLAAIIASSLLLLMALYPVFVSQSSACDIISQNSSSSSSSNSSACSCTQTQTQDQIIRLKDEGMEWKRMSYFAVMAEKYYGWKKTKDVEWHAFLYGARNVLEFITVFLQLVSITVQ